MFIKDAHIYINSAGRSGMVCTHRAFPKELRKHVSFVVPPEQYKEYRAALKPHWDVIAVDKKVPRFLPPQRQWLFDTAPFRYVWVMDDDLVFNVRTPNTTKLVKATDEDVVQMFEQCTQCLIDTEKEASPVAQVGVSPRGGNNRVEETYAEFTRCSRCYCVDTRVFRKLAINIAPMPNFVMEDFQLSLSLLEVGYKNRVYYTWAQGDLGSNTEGGCSVYRTFEVQKESAYWLSLNHPRVVETVQKTTAASWGGFKKDSSGKNARVDVRISWSKAFKQKQRSTQKGIAGFIR